MSETLSGPLDVRLQGVGKEAENVEQIRFPATIRSQDHAHGLQVVECDLFQDPVVLKDQLLDMGHGEVTFRRCDPSDSHASR